jgi:hypothetical protein
MGVNGWRQAPAALHPGRRPVVHHWHRKVGGPQRQSGRKNSPPPGFDPRTFQPVASRCTDWAIIHTSTQPCFICPGAMEQISDSLGTTSISVTIKEVRSESSFILETNFIPLLFLSTPWSRVGGVGVELHSFLTLALNRVSGQLHDPAVAPPAK